VPLGNGMNVDIDVTVDVKPDQETTDNLPPWKPTCHKLGEKCMSDDDCCDPDAQCEQKNPGWDKRCAKKVLCKEKGEHCEWDQDCCDTNAECIILEKSSFAKPQCSKRSQPVCAREGEECKNLWINSGDPIHDCCDPDAKCEDLGNTTVCVKGTSEDCIPDGEPCHGTDDWQHTCCTQSCCKGKCGDCSGRFRWGR